MSARVSRRRALLTAGVAVSVGVAGCSGSDDQPDERQQLRREEWADVDEIRLEGFMRGFYGVEPNRIAGIQNPALLLVDGQEYDLTWQNGDGGRHNIAIWNEDRQVVDDLSTRLMNGAAHRRSLSRRRPRCTPTFANRTQER